MKAGKRRLFYRGFQVPGLEFGEGHHLGRVEVVGDNRPVPEVGGVVGPSTETLRRLTLSLPKATHVGIVE